ncbi:related to ALG14 Essential protein required for the second step of dolichyl-linked oligosaccharide synthesis [Phialocephala subalpina]|uniref:UDP-N-acetylglucosamine transferase subunit ALG14 n=1 Tax=Phialocephala subalpina TaxID=576137 RepID=A0A1L7X3J8_9HELO|nr:related to ALG14 Essential protein required for the second step of dolichyl-linked oligosaccharide synthesis [Phialocephala subalpina]
MSLPALRLITSALFLIITTIFLRATYILSRRQQKPSPKTGPSHILIVLGSGGHTAEMMSLLRDLDPKRYFHRTYIVSSGDNFSQNKAGEVERTIQTKFRSETKGKEKGRVSEEGMVDSETGIWEVRVVPRARKIHQPLFTTPLSSLWCLLNCFYALYGSSRSSKVAKGQYPDVIVTNGPATAVIVILSAKVLQFFGVAPLEKLKIVYVESWARVRSLSLSGRILLGWGVCDRFLVQWEGLARRLNGNGTRKRVDWEGFLVG